MARKITSFTSLVKEEIIAKPFVDERVKALLSGFCKANGRYVISNKGSRLELKSEHAKIAKYLYMAIKRLYGIDPRFAYTQQPRFNKATTYHVLIDAKVDEILSDLNLSFTGSYSLKDFLTTDDEAAGYLAGIFLATGSVNDPESSNYHLEMSSLDEHLINEVQRLIGRLKNIRLDPKLTKRRQHHVLYIKKSDQIADFMILIGATDATLEYETVRVNRDYSNSDNRWQNCELANMRKTLDAAERQVADIKVLKSIIGLEHLPSEKMIALAKLRLDDEGASLTELAERVSETVGKPVSKSNIAHLFRSINKLANRYRQDER